MIILSPLCVERAFCVRIYDLYNKGVRLIVINLLEILDKV